MSKRLLLAAGLAAIAFGARAQQQPQFSHYGFNGMYLSPAYAGITNHPEYNFLGRYQYAGYSGAFDSGGGPRTFLINGSAPVAALGGGIGAQVYRDEIANTKTTSAQLSYSYHLKMGSGKLGIGVQGMFNSINMGNYRARDPNDPFVPVGSTDNKFDAGAGLWYQSSGLYMGLGVNNLLGSKYKFEAIGANGTKDKTATFSGERHAYLTAGYNIEASSSVVITPTAVAKMEFAGTSKTLSFEAGGRATFNDRFWGGLGYRHQDAVTALAGLGFGKDNRYRLGYAFDLIVFNDKAKAPTSHEIMLSLRLPEPIIRIRPAIRTPRYSF